MLYSLRHSLRRSFRQLRNRRRCALCGVATPDPAARYGSLRFCSTEHRAEWHASSVL